MHQLAEGEKCNNSPHCKHCSGDHSSTSRTCSKYKDEENIVHMQIDSKISSSEARKIYFEKSKKGTMASEIQKRLTPVESEKDKIIAELRAEIEALKSKITTIESAYERHRDDSQKERQQERKQKTITPTSSSPQYNQSSQRLSRKERTFISPPTTRSSTKKNEKNPPHVFDKQLRSSSRKHPIEISPTDTNHTRGKRLSCLTNADEYAIDVDE